MLMLSWIWGSLSRIFKRFSQEKNILEICQKLVSIRRINILCDLTFLLKFYVDWQVMQPHRSAEMALHINKKESISSTMFLRFNLDL